MNVNSESIVEVNQESINFGYSIEDGINNVLDGRAGVGIEPGQPRWRYLKEHGLSDDEIQKVQAGVNEKSRKK